MHINLVILITSILLRLSSCLDNVTERLTLKPLTNGDWFLTLDVSVTSRDFVELFENPEDPYFIMDVMPIDIAKLYLKTKSHWFEANLSFGEWKDSIWGHKPEILISNGLSLIASWPIFDKKVVNEHFKSLCFGLWGITGSMFSNLVNDDSYIHDITKLYEDDYNDDSLPNSTVLLSSDFEERACLDTVYKLRMLLPCLCTNGLVSLLGDERMFVRSSYRGVKLRVETIDEDLHFRTLVQFTVSQSMLPSSFSGFFPEGKLPMPCVSVSESWVKFVYPDSLEFTKYNELSLKYPDESLNNKYSELLSKFANGYTIVGDHSEIVFEVSELESKFLRVLKRVQSSLLIKVENLSEQTKKLCIHQPLPYWLKPLLHSIDVVVVGLTDDYVHYKCSSANCFTRNAQSSRNFNLFLDIFENLLPAKYHKHLVKFFDYINPVPKLPLTDRDPLMIYNIGRRWNNFGIYLSLEPKSVVYISVELSKDNITYEDIHLSAHRGQLVPSGIILDLDKLRRCTGFDPSNLDLADFTKLSSFSCPDLYHFTTSFFSHIVLPDNSKYISIHTLIN
uniref:Gpi16 subunit, GPI transamidase component, putative n=1 Tax=Theileria annulata TaxID=5874 RepID=A0A3B0MWF6_THEAN